MPPRQQRVGAPLVLLLSSNASECREDNKYWAIRWNHRQRRVARIVGPIWEIFFENRGQIAWLDAEEGDQVIPLLKG